MVNGIVAAPQYIIFFLFGEQEYYDTYSTGGYNHEHAILRGRRGLIDNG